MTDFNTTEEYKAYSEGLHYDELVDILENVDREKYPERYRIIEDLISLRQRAGEITYSRSYKGRKRLPSGLPLIRGIYLFAFVVGMPVHIYEGGLERVHESAPAIVNWLINPTIMILILIGIFRQKSWVVGLVLLFSTYQFLGIFFGHFAMQEAGIADDTRRILGAVFFAYSIVVFSRTKTRSYFKDKGAMIV